MTSAILVIDVQQEFCGGPRSWDVNGLLSRINAVTRAAREAGAPVLFIQHEGPALPHGSPGWHLAEGLRVEASDLRVPKTTPDAFLRSNVQELLQARHVGDVVVCGLHTQFCIDTTVRRALALGYPVTLVSDAHWPWTSEVLTPQQVIAHHEATLASLASFGPRVQLRRAAELDLRALSPLPSA
ncbi:cysteine hydrolase [Ramlibacter sp. USB13]|uniref:Cysteine hydrolase n=1 Tax=Ramlibacter cellulosilyticus TaxID=2764187 RepID=A0A923SBH6_9BURK|nr:cysteine hydrolase family protein [Ramlibacter cellulosilyticus]MBC5783880.1 cysteine hydrolase [Ramlibacter cellulosilyticus]